MEKQGGYHWLDSEPRTLAAAEHRPAYGTDGSYFSKPQVEDVFDVVYELMHESDPARYPAILSGPSAAETRQVRQEKSMSFEIILPEMGEGVIEGTLTRWLVSQGDTVGEFEPIAEVETDKVTTEMLSEVAGVVLELRVNEGETVPVRQRRRRDQSR